MADAPFVIGSVAVDQDLLNAYAGASFNVEMAAFEGGFNGAVTRLPDSPKVIPANAVNNPKLTFGMAATQLDLTNTSGVDSGARPASVQGRGPVVSRRVNVAEFFDHAVSGYGKSADEIASELGRQAGLALAQDAKKYIYYALKGAISAATTSTHINDETAQTTKTLQVVDIFDAKTLLGDASSQLRALVLHSKQLASVEKDLLTGTYNIANIGDMMVIDGLAAVKGMRVIVDDDCYNTTVSAGVKYSAFLLGPGAVWMQARPSYPKITVLPDGAKGVLSWKVLAETHYAVGVAGMDYDMNPTNPTQAHIATAANWAEAFSYDHKDLKACEIITLDG